MTEKPDVKAGQQIYVSGPGMSTNADLEQFMRMLGEATEKIKGNYFQLSVWNADRVYRERVYAYELYHQLRCVWGSFNFSLNGEVDKSGHEWFSRGRYASAKPDLIVHKPGYKDGNLVVAEIKQFSGRFLNDLEKLTWFCEDEHLPNYIRGIFLVYGNNVTEEAVRKKVQGAAKRSKKIKFNKVEVLCHLRVGHRAMKIM